MKTPEGYSADNIEKVMLFSMWGEHLKSQCSESCLKEHPLITASIGKPTMPMHPEICKSMKKYWTQSSERSDAAITYGHPQGDLDARQKMAQALSRWYETEIKASNILYTVGGAAAIHVIFETLRSIFKNHPNFRILTPNPYYSLYANNHNHLHCIPVMDNVGYQLTADVLEKSLDEAHKLAALDKCEPKVLLLCEPNNPLGTVLGKNEATKIASILRQYPELIIVLDEAYAEMQLDGKKHLSLLTIAPDLKNRMIILRSATKALSAAGERMAILMAFDPALMTRLLEKNILLYGHAPRSAQAAYAAAMLKFNANDRQKIVDFYKPRVDYVARRLLEMGAAMPNPLYEVKATFYVLANLEDLFHADLSESCKTILEKKGKITSDEDLAYSLLFEDLIMIAPLSYFGVPKEKGYMRITCSDDLNTLKNLMDRIEKRLTASRKNIKVKLENHLNTLLKNMDPEYGADLKKMLFEKSEQLQVSQCLILKSHISQLQLLIEQAMDALQSTPII